MHVHVHIAQKIIGSIHTNIFSYTVNQVCAYSMKDAFFLLSAGIYANESRKLFDEINIPRNPIKTIFPAIGGFIAGDLVSGIVHYSLDTFNSDTFAVAHKSFRIHHDKPLSMETFLWIGHVCEITPLTIPAVTATRKMIPKLRDMGTDEDTIAAIGIFVLVSTLVAGSAQIAHRFAHRRNHENARDDSVNRVVPEVPLIVKFLQDNHLMLHPDHHRKHHVTEIANYCISNGITSAMFDKLIDMVELPISQFTNRKDDDGKSTHTYLTHEEKRSINRAYDEADNSSRDIGRPYNVINLLKFINPLNHISEK
jgi:hypothetical protein